MRAVPRPKRTRPAPPLEKDVERRVIALYKAAGCVVYRLSQGYRSERGGTRQTPGIPDLYVIGPEGWGAWWHETKRPGGKLRPAQAEFRRVCQRNGLGHVVGGVAETEQWLVEQGLARDNGAGLVIILPPSLRRVPRA